MRFIKFRYKSGASDAALIRAYQQSKELTVLGDLYGKYLEYVFGVCLKYLENDEAAKDAVMDIFQLLIDRVAKHEIRNFKNWIYVVAKNHCFERIRKHKKVISAPLDHFIMHSNDLMHHDVEFELTEQYFQLYECVSRLSGEQKRSIELFYFEGCSYEEIADKLNVDKDKIRSYIQNGRRNLRNCLQNHLDDE